MSLLGGGLGDGGREDAWETGSVTCACSVTYSSGLFRVLAWKLLRIVLLQRQVKMDGSGAAGAGRPVGGVDAPGPGLVAKTLADFLNSSPVRAKLFAATAVARPYEEAEFDAGLAAIRLMPLPIPTVSDWEDDPDVPVAFENFSLRTAIGKVIRQELRADRETRETALRASAAGRAAASGGSGGASGSGVHPGAGAVGLLGRAGTGAEEGNPSAPGVAWYYVHAVYPATKNYKGIRKDAFISAAKAGAWYFPNLLNVHGHSIFYPDGSEDLHAHLLFPSHEAASRFICDVDAAMAATRRPGAEAAITRASWECDDRALNFVRTTHYVPSQSTSPQDSVHDSSAHSASASLLEDTSPLSMYQSVELRGRHAEKLQRCHIKDKSKDTKLKDNENNMLALGLVLHHAVFDKHWSVTKRPQVVVTVDEAMDIAPSPPDIPGRSRVYLLFSFVGELFYTNEDLLFKGIHFKEGSFLVQENPVVWRTFVDVVDVPVFTACIAWKAKHVRRRLADDE